MSYFDLVPPRSSDTANSSSVKNQEIEASDTANFSRIKYDQHAELDEQINQFIARGGGITEVPAGASCEKHPPHEGDFAGHEWDRRLKSKKVKSTQDSGEL